MFGHLYPSLNIISQCFQSYSRFEEVVAEVKEVKLQDTPAKKETATANADSKKQKKNKGGDKPTPAAAAKPESKPAAAPNATGGEKKNKKNKVF